MPLILLLLLVVLGVVLLSFVLLPVSLWARYRSGRARRRVQGWVVRTNAWLFAVSALVFLGSAWIVGWWLPQAPRDALLGLLAGVAIGIVGLWLTRFEHDPQGYFFTPNRWLVLALILVVVTRIVAGLWLTAAPMLGVAIPFESEALKGGWLAIAGLLLGYHGSYAWGLRARLPAKVATR